MSIPTYVLVIAAILIVIAIYFTRNFWNKGVVDDGAAMPRGQRRSLTLFLLVFGSGLVFILVSLTSLDFPATPIIPLPSEMQAPTATPTPAPASATPASAIPATATPATSVTQGPVVTGQTNQTATNSPTTAAPVLVRVFPHVRGETTITPRLTIYGTNFTKDSKVLINKQRAPSQYLGDNLITVPMESEYLTERGSILVEVENGTAVSNAIPVPIEKPRVQLNVFFLYYPWVTREIQLLLLVIFAGALGSYLHAVMSLTEFIAGRKLIASWFWWYMTRPFLGMAMGLVFYAVLRGGFLAGTPADANVVNPFGVLAIGALVGMFSDKAAQKLAEIFDVVFRSAAARSDKLEEDLPLINKVEPATVVAGGTEPVTVTITGEHLGNVSKVRVNKIDRNPDLVEEKVISFNLTPEDMAKPGKIEIMAVKPGKLVSEVAIINVSAPTHTDATSPEIGGLEPATIVAGGTEPVNVKITGSRLATVSNVQVNKLDRKPESVSDDTISFKLNPEEIAQAGEIEIIAVSPGGNSPPAILKVSEPPPATE